jgi:hypothetical protein
VPILYYLEKEVRSALYLREEVSTYLFLEERGQFLLSTWWKRSVPIFYMEKEVSSCFLSD